MKKSLITVFLLVVFGVFMFDAGLEADTKTATASISVTIPSTLSVELGVDETTPGQADAIVFDTIDSEDMLGDNDASDTFMYAPVRSANASWHYAKVNTTNANWSIEADVTTVPAGITKNKFKIGFGGGWRWDAASQSSNSVDGLDSDPDNNDYWKSFPNTRSTTDGTGEVKCYYGYQLDISGTEAGTYSGGVVRFTVTTS